MFIALIIIAISLALLTPPPTWLGWYIMAFILVFDSAYAWSWGPLVSSTHMEHCTFLKMDSLPVSSPVSTQAIH